MVELQKICGAAEDSDSSKKDKRVSETQGFVVMDLRVKLLVKKR